MVRSFISFKYRDELGGHDPDAYLRLFIPDGATDDGERIRLCGLGAFGDLPWEADMKPLGREKTILLFEASVTPANRRAYDGVYRYAETARWNVRAMEYSLAADKRTHGMSGAAPAMAEILDLWNPDGIIVECAGRAPHLPLDAFGKLPLVLLDCHPSFVGNRMTGVYTDAISVAKAAAREFLPLGISNFAYLPYTEDTIWSQNRGEAFADLIQRNGLWFRLLNVPKRPVNAVRLVERIVPQVKELPRPCGIFAANDEVARAVISACEKAELNIPNDIAVIGVDNDESVCENAAISLSSVRIDFDALGYSAARLLDEKMSDRRAKPVFVAVESAEVVRRASSSRLPSADARVVKAIEYIRRNACAGITPPDVVREMGCSRRLADLRFTETVGHTILDEIHAVRIEKVKELLMKPGQEIAAIPGLCGYGSLADLCRDFKKRTGMTLHGWRNARRG